MRRMGTFDGPIPLKPVASLAQQGVGAIPAALLPNPFTHRVLVVEDDYLLAEDLRTELQAVGADVLGPVADLAGAQALLACGPTPTAAILDIKLRGELVYPLADALRERGITFIFATGYEAEDIPAAYADVPRCEKPFHTGHCLGLLFAVTTEDRLRCQSPFYHRGTGPPPISGAGRDHGAQIRATPQQYRRCSEDRGNTDMVEGTGTTEADRAMAQDSRTDPALPDEMPKANDAILRRLADLEEHVGYLETTILRLREDVRLGDACAARFIGYLAMQTGIEMNLCLGSEIGPSSNAIRRFKVALDMGADPASATLLVGPRSGT